MSDEEILQRTHAILAHGARHRVWPQYHPARQPGGMTRALMALVHDAATPEEAAKHLS